MMGCGNTDKGVVEVRKAMHIVLIGDNVCSRMINFGTFETELHMRYPDSTLYIRNMCDGGDNPGFRPHSGRDQPWAFEGAEAYYDEFATNSGSQGHLAPPDDWLTQHQADLIVACFGASSSEAGPAGIEAFKSELEAFIDHTKRQRYNGKSAPGLVLVGPIAREDLSDKLDLPEGVDFNRNLAMYNDAMRAVADSNDVPFLDAFEQSQAWYGSSYSPLTTDGLQLNEVGYDYYASLLANFIFGEKKASQDIDEDRLHAAVMDKNWFWHNDFKIPNGVHVFGRRYEPFGPDNYPAELKKVREMTAIRDTAIWAVATGVDYDTQAADSKTTELPPVETNYKISDPDNPPRYLYGDEALSTIQTAPGFRIELFASEKDFTDLANPVQLSFDNAGRLWVAVMPSYPHYRPGDSKPDDKLLILEDTDGDGRADKQTVFADGLHLPIGFEFAPEGVYVSQGTNLKLFRDTDGDDRADKVEIILSGFDDHDTHHAISAFCADPSGAIYMGEGVFLHTNVETPHGNVRATNGGFYRFAPQRRHLERTSQISIPNPWGIAFDEWGQNFFAETSGPDVLWMLPGSILPRYGNASPKGPNIIEDAHRVRPTSGLEFVSSRHFPDDMQGDLLINNTIGFLGAKQHEVIDGSPGYTTRHRQDLFRSSDPNFRPVDMEFAPDGSLYVVDWHNVLIGHMQHNARDPLRDHVHGRIYRVTYPARPLVEAAEVEDASIEQLLENLKLPEYRTRYRTRRELRKHSTEAVMSALDKWTASLDPSDPRYEHHLLEALWVTWGLNDIDKELLIQLLDSDDRRVRAAAVRAVRYNGHKLENQVELLEDAVADSDARVRLEAIVAASWLPRPDALKVLGAAARFPMDEQVREVHGAAVAHASGEAYVRPKDGETGTSLSGDALAMFIQGKEIYQREGFCGTCHQEDGQGLASSGYPPLAATDWVLGDEERLIKLTLHGVMGEMVVNGETYAGTVPMTPFRGMLDNDEVAAVLTYVRNAFGNSAPPITPMAVATVRQATEGRNMFYSADELNGDEIQ